MFTYPTTFLGHNAGGGGSSFTSLGGEQAVYIPSLDDDGNGTTTLTDLAGSSDGTLTDMDAATDWVTDTDNGGVRALDFDGVDDYVNCGTGGAITGASDRSNSFWVKTTDTHDQTILVYGDTSLGGKWEIRTDLVSSVYVPRLEVNGGHITGNTQINDGNWHHVVVTFSGTNVTDANIYLDGVLETVTSASRAISTVSSDVLLSTTVSSRRFQGRIDDVRIFNKELTSSEVSSLYDSGNGRGY